MVNEIEQFLQQASDAAQLGDFDRALATYDRALALDEQNTEALCGSARCLLERQRPTEARARVETALQAHPEYAAGWCELGVIHGRQQQHEAAYHAFARAAELDPARAEIAHNVAEALCRLGRHEEALCHFDRAIETNDRFAPAYFGKARALLHLGRHNDALPLGRLCLAVARPEDPVRAAAELLVMLCEGGGSAWTV